MCCDLFSLFLCASSRLGVSVLLAFKTDCNPELKQTQNGLSFDIGKASLHSGLFKQCGEVTLVFSTLNIHKYYSVTKNKCYNEYVSMQSNISNGNTLILFVDTGADISLLKPNNLDKTRQFHPENMVK